MSTKRVIGWVLLAASVAVGSILAIRRDGAYQFFVSLCIAIIIAGVAVLIVWLLASEGGKGVKVSRIRSSMQPFLIKRSHGLFGDFDYSLDSYSVVLARNPEEAVKRYCKRCHCSKDLKDKYYPQETNEMFGKFRVIPKNKPYIRFVTYWT